MKKDIPFYPVENVSLAVVKEEKGEDRPNWMVYILNANEVSLENVLITSKGYGIKDGEQQKTSTLRHMIPHLGPNDYALVEPIDPSVFHLNNEYWVSYYIDRQIYDKRYVFVPDSLLEKNLTKIGMLNSEGILHP